MLAGERGPQRDVVVLNAAAGLVAAGQVVDLEEGVAQAAKVIDDGRAAAVVDRLALASQRAAQAHGAPA